MNTKYRFGMNIGSASLVLIFAVLCLTLFATLTLLSAKNEMNLTDKYSRSVTQYYAADSKAEENLLIIQDILSSANADKTAYIKNQCEKYKFTYVQKNNKIYITFNENINMQQILHVTVKVNNKKFEIIQWKKISANEINIDESINVYK
ncbi:MAG: hypothetical protein GYA50_07565 [Eubacteriaceae bacterium]|nr:hypothetical protein [Eubacteriaceae bacterium]